jgi:hypothetical protein
MPFCLLFSCINDTSFPKGQQEFPLCPKTPKQGCPFMSPRKELTFSICKAPRLPTSLHQNRNFPGLLEKQGETSPKVPPLRTPRLDVRC